MSLSGIGRGLERVERLIGAREIGEAVGLLSRATRVSRSTEWIGSTAFAIGSLRGLVEERSAGLRQLLQSSRARRAFGRLPRSDAAQVAFSLTHRRPRNDLSPQSAWTRYSSTFLNWGPSELRTSLAAIGTARGIGYAILAAERAHGRAEEGAFEEAITQLGALEVQFVREYRDQRNASEREKKATVCGLSFSPDAMREIQKGKLPIDDLFDLHLLLDFLQRQRVRHGWPLRGTSHLLTDFLRGRQRGESRAGACFPLSFLVGHLADLVGIPLDVVFHTRHANLFHRRLGLVLEPLHEPPFLSTLGFWRRLGTLGIGQDPAPLQALMAGSLVNLGISGSRRDEDRITFLMEAALSIYPGYPTALVNLALKESRNPRRALRFLARAIRVHPRHARAHELTGDNYLRLARRRNAARAYRKSLGLIRTQQAVSAEALVQSPDLPFYATDAERLVGKLDFLRRGVSRPKPER